MAGAAMTTAAYFKEKLPASRIFVDPSGRTWVGQSRERSTEERKSQNLWGAWRIYFPRTFFYPLISIYPECKNVKE